MTTNRSVAAVRTCLRHVDRAWPFIDGEWPEFDRLEDEIGDTLSSGERALVTFAREIYRGASVFDRHIDTKNLEAAVDAIAVFLGHDVTGYDVPAQVGR